jgi:hypothetical protein
MHRATWAGEAGMDEGLDGQEHQESRTEFGEILMHPDEAKAIFQTELFRQVMRRGIAVEHLQPRMVPQLVEANMDAMLTVLAENNHRVVDLLYRMGLINFAPGDAPGETPGEEG